MHRDKSGGNNPQAKLTIVIKSLTASTYSFDTVKEAVSFLQCSKKSLIRARDNILLFKDR